MINLTKQQQAVHVDVERGAAREDSDYDRAVAEIERLERELKQAKNALGESLDIRNLMSESLKKCTATLNAVEYQLKSAEAALIYSNKRVNEYVEQLRQENRALKLSADMWLNRNINLKFDLLVANDTIKTIKAERDQALSNMTAPGS